MKRRRELHCTVCDKAVSTAITDPVMFVASVECSDCYKKRRDETKRLASHVYRCQAASGELHDLAARILDHPSLAHGMDGGSKKIEIEIEQQAGRGTAFNVYQGDKYADGLAFDEMLGLVAALTMPEQRRQLQWMKTQADHDAWHAHLKGITDRNREEEVRDAI
jgi:hypothetical protein